MNKSVIFFLLLCLPMGAQAQLGTLSGDLQTNINFFQKDAAIGAANTPLYDNYLTGSETWLSARYNVNGWTFSLRADVFNNSNLNAPKSALSLQGVGAWSVTKEMDDLTITGGYIYDQVGSGLLFRSYEDRGLLIDNALVGLELKYKLTKQIMVKGFTGQQKVLLAKYGPVIRGFNAEGDFNAGKVHIIPGIGVLNRTLDNETMNKVAANINNLEVSKRFYPKWNMYAFTVYNTLTWKTLSWYVEGAYKTNEAINNAKGSLVDTAGNIIFTTINYAKKGIAINVSAKRTENFVMRTSPNEQGLTNSGMLNWQPVVARLRPQRLLSRYTPPSQDLSELATTIDVQYVPNDALNFAATYTNINKLNNAKLYREGFGEVLYQGLKSWIFEAGFQYMEYDLLQYQSKGDSTHPIMYALSPFTEITYRLNDTKSIRFEAQYMSTKQDYGSWVYGLLEFNVAPKFSISVSDMYNLDPNKKVVQQANHYYSVYGAFTKGPHRFSLAYVKQVEGINCSGGVCRYEPAFSGIRSTFTTSF